jgi:hypothetical protein
MRRLSLVPLATPRSAATRPAPHSGPLPNRLAPRRAAGAAQARGPAGGFPPPSVSCASRPSLSPHAFLGPTSPRLAPSRCPLARVLFARPTPRQGGAAARAARLPLLGGGAPARAARARQTPRGLRRPCRRAGRRPGRPHKPALCKHPPSGKRLVTGDAPLTGLHQDLGPRRGRWRAARAPVGGAGAGARRRGGLGGGRQGAWAVHDGLRKGRVKRVRQGPGAAAAARRRPPGAAAAARRVQTKPGWLSGGWLAKAGWVRRPEDGCGALGSRRPVAGAWAAARPTRRARRPPPCPEGSPGRRHRFRSPVCAVGRGRGPAPPAAGARHRARGGGWGGIAELSGVVTSTGSADATGAAATGQGEECGRGAGGARAGQGGGGSARSGGRQAHQ